MSWARRHAAWVSLLALCGVTALIEGALVWTQFNAARVASRRLDRVHGELRSLLQKQPALTSENTASIEADLAETWHHLGELRAALVAVGERADVFRGSPPPAQAADGYFDIASFVERMREHGERQGVQLNPHERFGFAGYSNRGPEAADLSAVFRERCVTEYLLQSLFDTRPYKLVAVQRERRTRANSQPSQLPARRGTSIDGDFFAWDPRGSVRKPNAVDTFAIRVSFISQTVSLRLFLNELTAFELPLVIREIEVAPVDAEEEQGPAMIAEKAIAPLVPQLRSKFTITVELVELIMPAVVAG